MSEKDKGHEPSEDTPDFAYKYFGLREDQLREKEMCANLEAKIRSELKQAVERGGSIAWLPVGHMEDIPLEVISEVRRTMRPEGYIVRFNSQHRTVEALYRAPKQKNLSLEQHAIVIGEIASKDWHDLDDLTGGEIPALGESESRKFEQALQSRGLEVDKSGGSLGWRVRRRVIKG